MDQTNEKIKRLLRRSIYLVVSFAIYMLAGSLLLLILALPTYVAGLVIDWLYGVPGTWYIRLGLNLAKTAVFVADIYVFLRFVHQAVDHVESDP